jgi:D-hexose-6-phosphate mutarotase
MENKDVKYIVIQDASYNSITEAQKGLEDFANVIGWNPGLRVSYVMVKPRFRRWVPQWLRNLLTKR